MEVSPELAHDTAGTVAEARRLWAAVDRPNLMIKVPGTEEGIPAIRQLIAEGINVNITLLFSVAVYERGGRGLPGGARGPLAERRRRRADRVGGELLRQPDRLRGRPASEQPRPGQGGDRQREGRPMPAFGSCSTASAGRRCAPTAPRCSGCCGHRPAPRTRPTRRAVRRVADRSRHGRHDSARDLRGLQGARRRRG